MPPSVLNQQIINIVILLVNVIFPTIERIFRATHHSIRQLYHTSILSGEGWVQELLHGHPERIRTELGMHKSAFRQMIFELRHMGHSDSKYVSLEEQLAIFLYMCVTGLTIRHVGERFQRSNETISRRVEYKLWYFIISQLLCIQILSENGLHSLFSSILFNIYPPTFRFSFTISPK